MREGDPAWIADMVDAARSVLQFIDGVDEDGFGRDPMRESAVIRQLVIAGEAARQVSATMRTRHAEVPWRDMAGVHDILAHGYRKTAKSEVWKAATVSIPEVLRQLESVLAAEGTAQQDDSQ